jgi:hypothetical protein
VPGSLVKVALVIVAVRKFILALSMLVVVLPKSPVHIALGDLYNSPTLLHIVLPFALVNVAVRIIVLADSILFTPSKISCINICIAESVHPSTAHFVILPVSFVNIPFFVTHYAISSLDLCLEISFKHCAVLVILCIPLEVVLFPCALDFFDNILSRGKNSRPILQIILKRPLIYTSRGKLIKSLTIFSICLPLSMVLISIGICHCSLTLLHVIDKRPLIMITAFIVVISNTVFHAISEFSFVSFAIGIMDDS